MSKNIIFVGYDHRDRLAYQALLTSIMRHASEQIQVVPIIENKLRASGDYLRPYHVLSNGQMIDDQDQKPFSTSFSFSRFLTPQMARRRGFDGLALFMDADMYFQADPCQVFHQVEERKRHHPDEAVWCVHHEHTPTDDTKMDGVVQTRYFRKNWSSFMVFDVGSVVLTSHEVNSWRGSDLHSLKWAGSDDKIGILDPRWNYLHGYSEGEVSGAWNVHFTNGTPDMTGEVSQIASTWWIDAEGQHAAKVKGVFPVEKVVNPSSRADVDRPAA